MASIALGSRYERDDPEADDILNITHLFLRDSVESSAANFFPFLIYLPKTRNNLRRNMVLQNKFFAQLNVKIANSKLRIC